MLARDTVRYVGEPIAVVVAESLAPAQDAAELVLPESTRCEAVTDVEAAVADDAPAPVARASGRTWRTRSRTSWDVDVLAGADVVVAGGS